MSTGSAFTTLTRLPPPPAAPIAARWGVRWTASTADMVRRVPRASDSASLPRRVGTLLLLAVSLRRLPRKVVLFYVKALWTARRADDDFARRSGTRPRELTALLAVARGHRRVVELGTGSGTGSSIQGSCGLR